MIQSDTGYYLVEMVGAGRIRYGGVAADMLMKVFDW